MHLARHPLDSGQSAGCREAPICPICFVPVKPDLDGPAGTAGAAAAARPRSPAIPTIRPRDGSRTRWRLATPTSWSPKKLVWLSVLWLLGVPAFFFVVVVVGEEKEGSKGLRAPWTRARRAAGVARICLGGKVWKVGRGGREGTEVSIDHLTPTGRCATGAIFACGGVRLRLAPCSGLLTTTLALGRQGALREAVRLAPGLGQFLRASGFVGGRGCVVFRRWRVLRFSSLFCGRRRGLRGWVFLVPIGGWTVFGRRIRLR